jgi:hypothetical protein
VESRRAIELESSFPLLRSCSESRRAGRGVPAGTSKQRIKSG